MIRRLFTILSILSLLAFLALTAKWALLPQTPLAAWSAYVDADLHCCCIIVVNGQIVIGEWYGAAPHEHIAEERQSAILERESYEGVIRAEPRLAPGLKPSIDRTDQLLKELSLKDELAPREAHGLHCGISPVLGQYFGPPNNSVPLLWDHAGITCHRDVGSSRSERKRYVRLAVPIWMLAAMLLVAPLWRAVAVVRAIRRRRRGLCRICSYDLRAHKPGDRCPECGTLIPERGNTTKPAVSSRFFTLLSAASLLLCIALTVIWARSYSYETAPLPSTARAQAFLARSLAYHWSGRMTLGDELDFVHSAMDIPIEVDWTALATRNLGPKTPQPSTTWRQSRVGEVLVLILYGVDSELEYFTDGGVVRVTTRAARAAQKRQATGAKTPAANSATWECMLAGRRWTLARHRGILRLWLTPPDPAAVYQSGLPIGKAAAPDEDKFFEFAGFSLRHGGSPFCTWVIGIPLWSLMAIAALASLRWLSRAIRYIRQ